MTRAEAVTLPHTEVHALHSEQADADFHIWIAWPVAGPMGLPPGPRDVLYVLDANLFFGTAVESSRLMHQLYGETRPVVVVGVAYDTDQPAVQAELRARDFTPTVDSGFADMARRFPGAPEPTLPEGRRLGRADAFLAFLRDDVRPFVHDRVDVAPGGSTLWGASLGGLFAVYAMLKEPAVFDAYAATSPALWWDGGRVMEMEDERARRGEALDTEVALFVGADEERADIPMLAQFRMVSNVQELGRRLEERGGPSLRVTTRVLDGESHTSVVPASLTRTLRLLHGARRER